MYIAGIDIAKKTHVGGITDNKSYTDNTKDLTIQNIL